MARGVLLDIDGVLTVSWEPLPGASDTMSHLQREGIPFQLVTNTSSRSRREIALLLQEAGMDVNESDIVTAVSSAARFIAESYPGAGCLVLNEGTIDEDLFGVHTVDADEAEVVLLGGAGPSIGYEQLNAVFRLAMVGIPVVALHRNTRFETAAGPSLDMGAFIAGLELAARIEVMIVGKPAPVLFRSALAQLGVDAGQAVMVGDDIDSDVLGSQALGMTGVLVKTGKFRPADLERVDQPDLVLESIGELPDVLRDLAAADGAT